MGRPAKSRLETVYPPRGMRADRAAAYLDMSEASFLRLVSEGELPRGCAVKGMTIWDRQELDGALENWKSERRAKRKSFKELLGIEDTPVDR